MQKEKRSFQVIPNCSKQAGTNLKRLWRRRCLYSGAAAHFGTTGLLPDGAPQKRPLKVAICNQMWRARSLIIQTEYETFVTTDRYILLSLLNEKGEAMRKTLMALAAVATLAVSALAAPTPAHAQRGLGAAIAGGLIGGAIVGGALAGPGYYGYGPGYYGPGYGYYGGPAYVAGPGYGGCVWQRQRFWDGYGWRMRNVRVCG
jgi:hypothetical protein